MSDRTIPIILVLLMGVLFIACQSKNGSSGSQFAAPESDDFYQEIISYSGIDFVHTIGDDHLSNLVESVGGGAAFLDYDQDGFLDLYLCNGNYIENLSMNEDHPPVTTSENRLYRNNQDGTFKDVTGKAGVGDRGYGMGMTVGDYDNDGFPGYIYQQSRSQYTLP